MPAEDDGPEVPEGLCRAQSCSDSGLSNTPASLLIGRVQHKMSSLRPTSKLVNPIGTAYVGNALQRYLQSLRSCQPKSEMRKLARSNPHSAEALGCPFTASHEHSARTSEQTAQSCFGSPEINSLYSATGKQLHCFHPHAQWAIGTAAFM